MHPKLQKVFHQLETDKKQLLSEVSVLTDEAFMRIPASGKWSISQILTHLVTSERLSLIYMRKKILGADQLSNQGLWDTLKFSVLMLSQRLPIRYKAPAVVVKATPEPLALLPLLEQWDRVRTDMRKFLESVEDKNVRKKIYKHPIVGMLGLPQALVFMNAHVHHHWPQIKNLLKK